MVTDEASIVSERLNLEAASKAILHQAALGTVPNMGMKPSTTKRAASSFRKLIDKLTGAGNGE